MNQKYAKYLLEKTQKYYNQIAEHFSRTRSFIWPQTEKLAKIVKNNDKILDLGCGNGRLRAFFKNLDIEYIGIDFSKELIRLAKENKGLYLENQKFLIGSVLNLPFSANYFDKIFSIAVFHHIPSKKLRELFLKEAKRVLKPGGFLILTVWNLYRKKFLKHHLKYSLLKMIGKSKLDFKDIFHPWKNQKGQIIAQRYIHCFTISELKRIVQNSGFKIKEIGFLEKQKSNIYLIAEKPL